MNELRPLIAVLDDEPQFCRALARLLKSHGFEVVTYTLGANFILGCDARLPQCLLLDLHMPDLNGFEILERVAAQHLPVLVITGHDQPDNAARVRALGAAGYFLKPINETQLLAAIASAIAQPLSPGPSVGSSP